MPCCWCGCEAVSGLVGREGEAVLLLLAGPELGVLGELREFSLDLSLVALRTLRLGPLIWKPVILGDTGKKLSVIEKGGRTAGNIYPSIERCYEQLPADLCLERQAGADGGRLAAGEVLTAAGPQVRTLLGDNILRHLSPEQSEPDVRRNSQPSSVQTRTNICKQN